MNNPLIEINTGSLSGDVFYGTIRINGERINVSNLTEIGIPYRFRATGKARAGFPIIVDIECNVEALPYYLSKNTTVVQMERLIDGKSYWFNILTTKGGKWHGIDKGFLEVMTVGDMRSSHPKMCDMNIWDSFGAKTWADKAFTQN